jgi:DNA-binding Lrp family transcriptional regulator
MTILDELDKRILQQMQQDASLTNHELAQRVHASAPTCMRRVKRLMEEGVIARQVVILSPEKVGAGLTAIVEITLDQQATERLTEFEQRIAARARSPTVLPGVSRTGFRADYSGRGYDGISCARTPPVCDSEQYQERQKFLFNSAQ